MIHLSMGQGVKLMLAPSQMPLQISWARGSLCHWNEHIIMIGCKGRILWVVEKQVVSRPIIAVFNETSWVEMGPKNALESMGSNNKLGFSAPGVGLFDFCKSLCC